MGCFKRGALHLINKRELLQLLVSLVVAVSASVSQAASMFLLDDEAYSLSRHRRSAQQGQPPFQPPEPQEYIQPQARVGLEFNVPPVLTQDDLVYAGSDSYGKGHYKPGIVGPVYTFVKTDPYAHVKWGVRHVAGKQYAHGR